MAHKVVSTACGLKIWPIKNILRFAMVSAKAVIQTKGTPFIPELVPGTLKIQDTPDQLTYKKKITFKVQHPDSSHTSYLKMLKSGYYVAEYIDEIGASRLSGSPSYPLKFSFSMSDGLYSCTLEGTGTDSDAYTL